MSDEDPQEPFICPRCHETAAVDDTCPRCVVRLIPRRDLPPWGLAARVEARPVVTLRGAVSHGVGLAWVLFITSAIVFERSSGAHFHAPFWFGPVAAMMALCMFLIVAFQLVYGLAASVRWKNARKALLHASEALPDVTGKLADVAEGTRGRIEGIVRVVRPTVTGGGVRCAAWQRTERIRGLEAEGSHEGPSLMVKTGNGSNVTLRLLDGTEVRRSGGGTFTLEGPSGTLATVNARHVVLASAGQIEDGDRVTVSGVVRWVAAPDTAVGHLRVMLRGIELVGTEAQPLVMRRLSQGAEVEPTHVRVSDRNAAAEGLEVDDDTREDATARPDAQASRRQR